MSKEEKKVKKESLIEKYGLEVPKVECPLCNNMIGAYGLTKHLRKCEETQEEKKAQEQAEMGAIETFEYFQIRKNQKDILEQVGYISKQVKQMPTMILNVLGNRIAEKVNTELAEWFKIYQKDLEKIRNQNGFLVNLCKEMKMQLGKFSKIRIIGSEPL